MKILFVPAHPMGAISHGIPLLALSKMLDQRFTTAFLLPEHFHKFFRAQGENVLNIAHKDLSSQMIAYHRFKPDVIVDDLSVTTAFANQLRHIPRVTIQRTGLLPGTNRPHDHHSSDESLRSLPNVTPMGLTPINTLPDLVKADAVIIPAIKSIERLSDAVGTYPPYFYSGPLLGNDCSAMPDGSQSDGFRALNTFLERHSGTKMALVTFGTIAEIPPFLPTLICRLLEMGVPVLSTVPLREIPNTCESLFHFNKFLPLHRVCERVSVVIHHCGSGTYQYPLMYQIPSVIIGTGYYDRDDVAKRLHELGAATFLKTSSGQEEIEANVERSIRQYLDCGSPEARSAKEILSKLRKEMEQTAASFNFDHILFKIQFESRCSGSWTPR